ncbi:LysR family transcriptional regulator [Nakamurella sp. YIM 132087]|uniref:LysR family transcriptional regulator n=1 Tax=Nakamurella alba TaxID=2665158 RepID=A0A7K1FMB2_9ACTN|nr:LysR family transcriptional regulator [Nakamurella alba]MTD14373.1 LysR family transcriptional regulator [Nakamurella alba]
MIDLVALRALMAVGRAGSVAAAGESLGYTASAISQQVKRLERETGVLMLERVGRGVVLTEQGRLLVEDGRRLFGQLEAIRSRLETAAPTGGLRLVAFATAVRGLVAPMAAALITELPGLTLTVLEQDPPEAVAMVAAGQADMAVAHDWSGVPLHRPAHVAGRVIGQDVADVLLPAGHPLAGSPALTPGELLHETWACSPPGSLCHEWFTVMFEQQDRLPPIRWYSGEYDTQIEVVAQGLAAALVPRLGRRALPQGVVAVPLRDPVPVRRLWLVWRETMSESPAVQEVSTRLAALTDPVPAAAPATPTAPTG